MHILRLTIALLCVPACVVGAELGPVPGSKAEPQPTIPTLESIAGGAFQPLPSVTGIEGRALMVRRLDGTTELGVALTGLAPTTLYTAHLHAAPCRYLGGGHYKIDPTIADTVETNELWLRAQSSATGAAVSRGTFPHFTRGEALSVVVHAPAGGAKLACADLISNDVDTIELSGTLVAFTSAAASDQSIKGTLAATRTTTSTSLTLELVGLDPGALAYGSHVHAEPCEVAAGGGHYKLDPTIVETVEDNEVWVHLTSYETGAVTATVQVEHALRTDAQSLVIHRTIDDVNKPKVACGNLVRMTMRSPFVTTATALALPAAADADITGTAIMTRKLTGVTEVAVVMTGLSPGATHMAHVHDQPCTAEHGGGHYKFDQAVTGAAADNEIWFELTANAEGTASDSTWVPRLAHADAQSLVVHGAEGARIGCFDLQ